MVNEVSLMIFPDIVLMISVKEAWACRALEEAFINAIGLFTNSSQLTNQSKAFFKTPVIP